MILVTNNLSWSCVICSNSNLSNALFLMNRYLHVDSLELGGPWGKKQGHCWYVQRVFAQEKPIKSNSFFFFYIFCGLLWLYWQVSLKIWHERGEEREGEWQAAKGPGPGVKPGSAAEPRHMGCALYPLSYTAPPNSFFVVFLNFILSLSVFPTFFFK